MKGLNSIFPQNLKRLLMSIGALAASFAVHAADPSDLCSAAPTLTFTTTCTATAFIVDGAFNNTGENNLCGSQDREDGWYKIIGTGDLVNIQTVSSNQRHALTVFTGTGTCGGAQVAVTTCQEVAIGVSTNVTFPTISGTTYYIQIHRTNNGANNVTLNGTICIKKKVAPGGVSNGLGSWYSADGNVVTTGTTVTSWNNNIDGSPNVTNSNGTPTRIANALNFNPIIEFNNGDHMYGAATGLTYSGAAANSVFMVNNYHSGAVIAKWEQTGQPLNRIAMEGMNTNYLRYDHPTETSYMINTSDIKDKWTLSSGIGSNTTDYLYINGLLEGSDPGGTNVPSASGSIIFGANLDGTWSGTFDMSEIIFFTTTVTATERNKIESYLATKYGITLGSTADPVNYTASTGLVYWTGSTIYQNDIAGIGRDDNGNLTQKKSLSVNSDGMVTMALTDQGGSFATPNSFDNNLEFMVWGNDNGSLVESASELPPGYHKRLPREWQVQETGVVGNVAVQFNISSLVVSGTLLSDFALIIDEDKDGDFTTGTIRIITPTSYSGGILLFNNVNFAHGEIFSLATDVDVTLPIDFISLEVETNLSHNIISWVTAATEHSNSFLISRSTDGSSWANIGKIEIDKKSGNLFSFIDINTSTNTIYYYRIIEVGNDGSHSYSKIVTTSRQENEALDYTIYPNPAKQRIFVYLNKIPSLSEPFSATIYSAEGKIASTNNLTEQENILNLNGLPPGLYILEVKDLNSLPNRKLFIIE